MKETMASAITLPRYQPLINPSDRLVRRPIAPWRAALLHMLGEALAARRIDVDRVAPALNQLALLEAYQGNTQGALHACDAQIRFWQRLCAEPGYAHHIGALVQPWVNIVRLERWSNKADTSLALYSELAPSRRSGHGSLQHRYGLSLTFDDIDRADPHSGSARLLDAVYWREYAHLLLSTDADHGLQRHLQAGLPQNQGFLRVVLTEILLAYQAKRGQHAPALALLRRMPVAQDPAASIPFKTLEMYLVHAIDSSRSAPLADALLAALQSPDLERDVRSLNMLVDIARLMGQLGMAERESAVLRQAAELAHVVKDEVLLFEVERRLARSNDDDLHARFAASSYALVRKGLGLAPEARTAGPDVGRIVESLAELDFSGCLSLLRAAPAAVTEASA